MKKRFLSVLTLLAMLVCLIALPAAASGEEYTFTVLADGKPEAAVKPGDEVTVTLLVRRTDGKDFDLYSIQDYLCFDPEYLRFVDGSIETWEDSDGRSPVQASAIKFNAPADEFNRVYMNRSGGESAIAMKSPVTLVSFRLEALKNGRTEITHDTVEIFRYVGTLWSAAEENAVVTISDGSGEPVEPSPGPDVPTPPPGGGGSGGGSGDDGSGGGDGSGDGSDDREPLPFVDVNKDDWFYDEVYEAYFAGLFEGVEESYFRPYWDTTRGMMATIMRRYAGSPDYSYDGERYIDVSDGAWYADGIYWATEATVMDGYGEGLFGPEDYITREQFAAVLWRYAGRPATSCSLSKFSDASSASGYAVPALKWAVEKGILNGRSEDALAPTGTATRAEVAAMLTRFIALDKEA